MEVKIPSIPKVQTMKLLEGSADLIYPHTAILVRLDTTICSGVFVKSFGYYGILTAGHCAKLIFEKERVAFAISEKVHQLWVMCKSLEHVPIAEVKEKGPDLSFILIKDVDLIRLIETHNHSFYDLDAQAKDVSTLEGPVITLHWCICGCSSEKLEQKYATINNEVHVLNTTPCAGMQGRLIKIKRIKKQQDYDYVYLELLAGFEGYPTEYEGNSGSGIWYQRFDTSDDINYTVKPILAGIVVWQEKKIKIDWKSKIKSRKISGHYFHSIYYHVRKALKDKKEAKK